ncbi:hypothetical protein NPIL_520041, partial [Nephila pilipes]
KPRLYRLLAGLGSGSSIAQSVSEVVTAFAGSFRVPAGQCKWIRLSPNGSWSASAVGYDVIPLREHIGQCSEISLSGERGEWEVNASFPLVEQEHIGIG